MANSVGVCTNNYLDTAALSASSADLEYPFLNLIDLQRRTKPWRTAGYWKIEAGANVIIFRETVGVDITATIAPGEYDTLGLAFVLKAALEATGVAIYTVTHVNTTRWKFESDLSSGATVFQLRFDSVLSTMGDALGFDSVAYTGNDNYLADDVRIHTEEFLLMDFGIPTNPKAFCLVGDRNQPLRISPTATIKLQAALTNSWAVPAMEITIPYADAALGLWDFEGLADVEPGYRYWRFSIIDRDNPRGYLEFGAGFLGDMITCTRGCAVFPLQLRGRDRSTIVVAEGGQVYGLKKPKTMGIGLRFAALLKQEAEDFWEHWETKGLTDNWFLILDAHGAFSTNAQNRIKLVRFAEEYQQVLGSFNNFSGDMTLEEAV